MTEEEIEIVAEELAKIGGVSWYPGRTRGPLLRVLSERYRERARIAIAAIDRLRAGRDGSSMQEAVPDDARGERPGPEHGGDRLQVGSIVVYRPQGDKRAVRCRIEKIESTRAYLVPCPGPDFGWVSLSDLSLLRSEDASDLRS